MVVAAVKLLRHQFWRRALSTISSGTNSLCPAGFYNAEKLLTRFSAPKVDILDRFPTSFELVRSGVAPDHPETKGLRVLLNSPSSIVEKQSKCCQKQLGVRGFAKTVQVPQSMQKPMKLKLYMGSPGVIGEPYKPPPPPLPLIRRWFTREGWSRRKQAFMGMIKTSYTIAKLRQKTKGYSQQRFYQEVSDLYKQINSSLAEGERTTLRHLVTDSVFSIMKNELKHRESSTWAKVDWEMVGPVTKMRTLQGRLVLFRS